jgi:hypothetical protein
MSILDLRSSIFENISILDPRKHVQRCQEDNPTGPVDEWPQRLGE